ncbi:hypothetical protein Tco_0652096 [Tanacetum coccineum]|uniref:Reverse transcriptase domain-containing protein n=1 Tax=Tanacetum coccineum TaxID=301880 RepID=A0ABQ4WWM4_9ASTR
MRTRSSSNLIVESSTTPKRRNRIRSKQRVELFSLEESSVDRFKDLLRTCPHHGFTELHQLDTFYNALNPTDQDSLNAAAGGNLLTKTPRDALTIIENKSKVRNSRNKPIVRKVSTNAPSSSTLHSPEIAALVDAVKAMLHQKSSPPAFVKAVEEICVTCGGPHPYHQCLATDGNVFPYNQNQGNNFNQGNQNYHAPPQVGPSKDLSNYMKTNDVNMRVIQNQISNMRMELKKEMDTTLSRQNNAFKNELRNELTNDIKNMMSSFFQMNTASSSSSGSLPSNTVANPRGDLKAITTRSGISYDGLPIPPPLSHLPKIVECLALADLGASINLMPLSIWRKLSLPELTPTRMILKLADQSTTSPSVVDYVVDPRVPLILERPFLRTARALIDVYSKELTLRVDDEAITFKVGQTSRYSYNDGESVNRIDVIDISCEEYAQEVLGFSNSSMRIDDADFDLEGDLLLLEKLLNDDPSSPLPPKELHFCWE